MTKRILSAKDILEKEFKPAIRGFNMKEVDEFLDKIIRDYESFEKEISFLNDEIERLKREQKNGKQNALNRGAINYKTSNHTTNYDILRRLSKLEKAVFGSQALEDQNASPKEADNTMIYSKH